ncbi:MAG: hypothetical protein GC191_01250 [Azospirillum sp.]|nr:hypothetical protein [Azospirillum sp.]
MSSKSRKKSAASPILDQIMHGGSSVSFNLIALDASLGEGVRMFKTRSLNQVILFKYPNFDDSSAADAFSGEDTEGDRPIETGIYVPYHAEEPEVGGYAVYLRSKNYGDLLKDHFGIDLTKPDPYTAEDLRVLKLIDGIPSLDAFLLKTCFETEKLSVDPRYWAISDGEDVQLRRLIAQRIEPIVRKAITAGQAAGNPGIERFLAAIWNADLPEARLFVSAFGIEQSEAEQVFGAWKGITFYEFQLRRIAASSRAILGWLKSNECLPVDIRANKHLETQLLMYTEKMGKSIEGVMVDIKGILSDYDNCFRTFMDGKPEPFRNFLRSVRKKYWLMGYCISSLGSVNHIFDRYMRNLPTKKLYFEPMYAMLKQFDVALDRRRERTTSF